MKEVVFKREYSRYNTVVHQDFSEVPEFLLSESYSEKHPHFKKLHSFTTEEEFVKNFANPLAEVWRQKQLLVVEKDETKVSIKFFSNIKLRSVGKPWFRVRKDLEYITVNKQTGDVYLGGISNYQKVKKCQKKIQKNFFLQSPLATFRVKLKNYLHSMGPSSVLDSFEAVRIFIEQIEGPDPTFNSNYSKKLFEFYLKKKGIKYPNNFILFAPHFFGGKIRKKLKKNGHKLVETFMEVHELKGDKIKKALHCCDEFLNVDVLKSSISLFPYDWISGDEELLKKILNFPNSFRIGNDELEIHSEHFSKTELKNIFSIFKEVIDNNIDTVTFSDHLRILYQLKNFGETDLRWKSKNKKEFNSEHLDWSDKFEHYRKGSYKRIYPDYFDSILNSVICIGPDKFYPKLLKSSEEYNEESLIQHNCVKTYIGRPSSIIVSLRKNSIDSEDRVTVEYLNFLFGDKFNGLRRVQTRGKYNSSVVGWDEVLEMLDKKMEEIVLDENFKTVSIEKKCANGVLLNSGSAWDDRGNLIWTFKYDLDNSYYNHIYFI